MATLYITEVSQLGLDYFGKELPVAKMPPLAEQEIGIGGASQQSAAFGPTTHFVLVHTDSICSLAFGSNPAAVTTAHRMPANETRFYGVNPGDRIAVISNT